MGGQGATPGAKTRQRPNVAPMFADRRVLWGGRDRLLKVSEVAEHLGVSNATVHGLCDSGKLPYVWIVNSIRIRPANVDSYVASTLTIAERPRPHRRKPPVG